MHKKAKSMYNDLPYTRQMLMKEGAASLAKSLLQLPYTRRMLMKEGAASLAKSLLQLPYTTRLKRVLMKTETASLAKSLLHLHKGLWSFTKASIARGSEASMLRWSIDQQRSGYLSPPWRSSLSESRDHPGFKRDTTLLSHQAVHPT